MSTAGDEQLPEHLSRRGRRLLGGILRRSPRCSRPLRTPLRWALERLDEHRARRLRAIYGERRWIVSWQRDGDGDDLWRARLSSPSLVITLERTGRTRAEAIERAARALGRILYFHGEFRRREIRFTPDLQSLDDSWR